MICSFFTLYGCPSGRMDEVIFWFALLKEEKMWLAFVIGSWQAVFSGRELASLSALTSTILWYLSLILLVSLFSPFHFSQRHFSLPMQTHRFIIKPKSNNPWETQLLSSYPNLILTSAVLSASIYSKTPCHYSPAVTHFARNAFLRP